jgi:hypothetical protein
MNPGTPVDSNVQPDPATTSDGKNLTPDAWCRKETAHVLLHEEAPGRYLPRPVKEVEAESVAYVVASVHGMNTDGYSFPYVAGWAGERGGRAVTETQSRVAQAARSIIAASPAEHTSGGRPPGVDLALDAARRHRHASHEAPVAPVPETSTSGPAVA